ncbi:MAG: hypothetical protein DWQ47_02190 [Acidobacteria bacterium]|nr:MAG: hypothetical protein DWQ32_05740 [Acidobacteriota bacterium]REK01230.1 MAG: hypothetical protein DWQ38_02175 [Acidobacteriota bacterium]REK14186.1 MAG: hypothetical protein DWQ43_11430 [Acidobacteriota bacterium]REK44901.1 MAG: hypothetical protein DWQ47_02190 [Acidobacteriota bacterium]
MNVEAASRKIGSLLIAIALAAGQAMGDVAPPPGYSAVGNGLELRAVGDLSTYRFFLIDGSGEAQEIQFEGSRPVLISPDGRGGPSRYCTLWAIAADEMKGKELGSLDGRLLSGQFASQTRLLDHNFRKDVNVLQSGSEHKESFEIAMNSEKGRPFARPFGNSSGNSVGISYFLIAGGVGGFLIFIAVAVMGIWLFRRSRKKSQA